MNILGFDTATPATAVALALTTGSYSEARDDPSAGTRPGHATRLLELAEGLLGEAGLEWGGLERIAVGIGPGAFTGLRVGVASAHGLARSLELALVGVNTLDALARGWRAADDCGERGLLALLDGGRGEVFASAYEVSATASLRLTQARALEPAALQHLLGEASLARQGERSWVALGSGAIAHSALLAQLGCEVPPSRSPLHLVRASAVCELARESPGDCGPVLPSYGRRADAEIALEGAVA